MIRVRRVLIGWIALILIPFQFQPTFLSQFYHCRFFRPFSRTLSDLYFSYEILFSFIKLDYV